MTERDRRASAILQEAIEVPVNQDTKNVDVLIGGAGFAGLALAIALRQALGPAFEVTVADPTLGRAPADARASAIVAAARRLFETIGVWDKIANEAQPILDMVVTDSRLQDAVRPVFLSFEGDVEPGEPFAHMVENGPLLAALVEKAKQEGVELRSTAVEDFSSSPLSEGGRKDSRQRPSHEVIVDLTDGTKIATRLLVGADGARSKIRTRAGILTRGWEYAQSSIVTTVAHERDNGGRAEEHFLPAGPFAILPLKGRRSSIVWTEEHKEAERIVALPDAEFHDELERRFGLHLGDIEAVAALAETIVDAVRLGLDPGSPATLDRYQRWRRFDTMAMGVATDGLNRLFSNQSSVLRLVRDVGLGLVDRLPALKQLFIREAAGLVGEVPKLLKGEAL